MVVGPKEVTAAVGPAVAAVLEGKGGGKGTYQGKASNVGNRGEAFEVLVAAIEGGEAGTSA